MIVDNIYIYIYIKHLAEAIVIKLITDVIKQPFDREICICIIKSWNDYNYGEITVFWSFIVATEK